MRRGLAAHCQLERAQAELGRARGGLGFVRRLGNEAILGRASAVRRAESQFIAAAAGSGTRLAADDGRIGARRAGMQRPPCAARSEIAAASGSGVREARLEVDGGRYKMTGGLECPSCGARGRCAKAHTTEDTSQAPQALSRWTRGPSSCRCCRQRHVVGSDAAAAGSGNRLAVVVSHLRADDHCRWQRCGRTPAVLLSLPLAAA